jgi:hypothetical protein
LANPGTVHKPLPCRGNTLKTGRCPTPTLSFYAISYGVRVFLPTEFSSLGPIASSSLSFVPPNSLSYKAIHFVLFSPIQIVLHLGFTPFLFWVVWSLPPRSSPSSCYFSSPEAAYCTLRLRLDIWVGQHCSNWLTLSLLFFLRHYKVARIKYSTVTQIKEAASAGSFLLRISHVQFVSIFTLYRST